MLVRLFRSPEHPHAEKQGQMDMFVRHYESRLAPLVEKHPGLVAESRAHTTSILSGAYEDSDLAACVDGVARIVNEADACLPIRLLFKIKDIKTAMVIRANPLSYKISSPSHKSDPTQPEQGLLL